MFKYAVVLLLVCSYMVVPTVVVHNSVEYIQYVLR